MPTSPDKFLETCPPPEFTFDYGQSKLPERQGAFYKCGMYLMLDYEGTEDSIILFQDLFRPYLDIQGQDFEVLQVLRWLLLQRLVSFDDEFYDLAISRFVENPAWLHFSQDEISEVVELFRNLKDRGYNLAEASKRFSESSENRTAP